MLHTKPVRLRATRNAQGGAPPGSSARCALTCELEVTGVCSGGTSRGAGAGIALPRKTSNVPAAALPALSERIVVAISSVRSGGRRSRRRRGVWTRAAGAALGALAAAARGLDEVLLETIDEVAHRSTSIRARSDDSPRLTRWRTTASETRSSAAIST